MLMHDKTNKNTATADVEPPTPTGRPAARRAMPDRPARRSRRWVWTLAATAAVVGLVTIAAVTQPDQDATNRTFLSDRYDQAETNRMETLRDLTTGSTLGGYDEGEVNRMENLRDLTTGLTLGGYDEGEVNRMENLRDLTRGS